MTEAVVILDRYEVIRRLAIGGMGEIFLARQRGAGSVSRLVVLKTLRPELAEQPDALAQFLDEARVAAMLSHPNIVAIYEVAEHNGTHLIAMEYIGGLDLAALARAVAKANERIPPRVAASLVRGVALGLDFAHHAKDDAGRDLHVVHRDVSPQNVMVRHDGLVKLVDFGVAVSSNQLHETQSDKVKGKLRYMSPEQLLGDELDGRSDQFSLGVVLWELLTGRPLFQSVNPIDVFQRVLSEERPRVSSVVDVPSVLDDIVARMLSRRRDERYARCAEVADALRAWLESTGGPAEDETRAFVERIAGAAIAERVRDLTPRPVIIAGMGERDEDPEPDDDEGILETSAPTRAFILNRGGETGLASAEHSEVLLAEGSGALVGDRVLVTVVVGFLPGWSAFVERIANVPMGAFGVNRLKNLFFRQLDGVAARHQGVVVQKGGDSFVLAFGIETAHPDDASRAAEAAFEIGRMLEQLGRDPSRSLAAHMGVASGLAVAATEDGALQLGGAVVENAFTLAALARRGKRGVLLSARSADLVEGKVQLSSVEIAGERLEDVFEASPLPDTVTAVFPGAVERRKKILIVDDADVFRRIEEEILRPYAYAFIHARDGAQCIKLAVEEHPDLILLDIQMPVVDGTQVLQFLKKTPQTKDIPVAVVTTAGRAHDEEMLRRAGAGAFLTKPVKPSVLVSTVKRLLKEEGKG